MKQYLKHAAAVAVLFGCTLLVFWFNASSASRTTVKEDPDLPDRAPVSGNDDQAPATTPDGEDPKGEEPTPPDQTPSDEQPVDPFTEFLAGFPTKEEQAGMSTALEWSDTCRFAVTLLSDVKTFGVGQSLRYRYSLDKNGALLGGTAAETQADLFLYEGLLLARQGDKTYVYDPESALKTDVTGYLPVYAVTENGEAVFYRDGDFYFWNGVNHAMQKTNEPSFRGLYYDGAPVPDADLTPFRDDQTGLWGYADQNGTAVIAPAYRVAFPFGENGVAAVQKTKTGGLFFIDKEGKTVYDPRTRLYTYNVTEVYDLFALPESLNGDAVGSLFFSEGYVVVTASTYAVNNTTAVLRIRTVLIDSKGDILPLPEDYNLRAYSEGVLVLEKNGLYGYYSCDGYWICDPVYRSAKPFSGGIGVVCDRDGRYQALDREGNALFALSFDHLGALSNGKMLGYRRDGGWMLFEILSAVSAIKE